MVKNVEYDPLNERCANTGLKREKCQCLNCQPIIHRFKWICTETKTIDDVIEILKGEVVLFERLKSEGWSVGGPIEDDYMELEPPIRLGYYWSRCLNCGSAVIVEDGVKRAPKECEYCRGAQVE